MSRVTVHPICDEVRTQATYDLAVGVCGFESRSRYFFEESGVRAAKNIATAYCERHGVSRETNQEWFESNGFEISIEEDVPFASRVAQLISESGKANGEACKAVVDISSFTRARLAALLEGFWNISECNLDVDFVYSLAEYYTPPGDVVINQVGPVGPLFAGWTDAPELPTTAVFGLGFEPGKVLGAAEYLESGDLFACIPDGPDPRFKAAVLESNSTLLDELGIDRTLSYGVGNPFDTFAWLEAMCAGLVRRSRLVLIPFGPKIFALNCMLVALVHSPRIMVLRVSGAAGDDHDVGAAGPIYKIRAIFRPTTEKGGGFA